MVQRQPGRRLPHGRRDGLDPAAQGDHLAVVCHPRGHLFYQARRGVIIRGSQRVPHSVTGEPARLITAGGPLVQNGQELRVRLLEAGTQDIGKQMMIPVPPVLVIQQQSAGCSFAQPVHQAWALYPGEAQGRSTQLGREQGGGLRLAGYARALTGHTHPPSAPW